MDLENNDIIQIYTDGACKGNPGLGAWGVYMRYKDFEKKSSGVVENTTNNQMELMAAIEGLKLIKKNIPIQITTDSNYLKKGITEWIENWKKNNWRTASNKPVKNLELWKELDNLCQKFEISWHWVKGHNGHPGNETADLLANQAIEMFRKNKI